MSTNRFGNAKVTGDYESNIRGIMRTEALWNFMKLYGSKEDVRGEMEITGMDDF